MKKIIISTLIILTTTFVFAEIGGTISKTNTDTSTISMHQSWDLDSDGINDCENDGTCDDSIDYTQAKTYSNSEHFLEAEGNICESATDGCNTIGITDGQLGPSTMMYCEDIYGENGSEKWSCNKYIENNIVGGDKDEHGCIGSAGYSWSEAKQECIRPWEEEENEPQICTMEYAPVCAQVQVQCIKAPCPPISQTFSNKCSAGKNEIIYNGECDSFIDSKLYKSLKKYETEIQEILSEISSEKLIKVLNKIQLTIEKTKLMKIAKKVQVERITIYKFLAEIVNQEINK